MAIPQLFNLSHILLTINPVKVYVAIIETVWEVIPKVGDIFLTILHSEETNTILNIN